MLAKLWKVFPSAPAHVISIISESSFWSCPFHNHQIQATSECTVNFTCSNLACNSCCLEGKREINHSRGVFTSTPCLVLLSLLSFPSHISSLRFSFHLAYLLSQLLPPEKGTNTALAAMILFVQPFAPFYGYLFYSALKLSGEGTIHYSVCTASGTMELHFWLAFRHHWIIITVIIINNNLLFHKFVSAT